MQSEHDHTEWLMKDGQEDAQAAYKFFMRPDPNQREFVGPIEEEFDPVLNKTVKFRASRVGTVRGQKEENMKDFKVYVGIGDENCLPHIRLDKGKELQGWYQDKNNIKQNGRPRPCFTEATLTEPYGGYCTVGCAFSLPPEELVDTPNGAVRIRDLRIGDMVWGRTLEGRVAVPVLGTLEHARTVDLIQIKLRDGRKLTVTADHPIYVNNAWCRADKLAPGDVLENMNDAEVLLGVRGHYSALKEGLRQLFASGAEQKRKFGTGSPHGFEGGSKIGGYKAEHERGGSVATGKYVSQSLWSKITRMESIGGGAGALWEVGVQVLQAIQLHLQKGSNVQHAFALGGVDGGMVGPQGLRLDLRAGGDSSTQRGGLSAGLSIGGRKVSGSEGFLFRQGQIASDGNAGSGSEGCTFEPAVVEEIGRVDGPDTVRDITTLTGNFYSNGVLVHNCYINSGFRGYRGSGLITVPINYEQNVRTSLAAMRTSSAGYFSSFTDPFLPLEKHYHNTQKAATAFVDNGLPIFFLSRLQYPGWAFDLLKRNKYSYAQKSLNTGDDEDFAKLSPGALGLSEHIEQVGELRKQGIYTSIQVNPIVAGVTSHDDIYKLFDRLAAVGNNHVIVKFVEASHAWAPAMVERITKRFGDNRAAAFRELFTENQPGAQKTITEEYRLEAHNLYRAYATKVGMTYATCYEYRRGRTPSEPGWLSVGREFTTADQCHGQRVPMFSRLDAAVPFSEVEACPPTGCLSCADDNAGKSRCGSDLFGAAKALRFSDFKVPIK